MFFTCHLRAPSGYNPLPECNDILIVIPKYVGYVQRNALVRMIAVLGGHSYPCNPVGICHPRHPIERHVKLKSFSQHEIAEKVVKVVDLFSK